MGPGGGLGFGVKGSSALVSLEGLFWVVSVREAVLLASLREGCLKCGVWDAGWETQSCSSGRDFAEVVGWGEGGTSRNSLNWKKPRLKALLATPRCRNMSLSQSCEG